MFQRHGIFGELGLLYDFKRRPRKARWRYAEDVDMDLERQIIVSIIMSGKFS